MRLRYKAITCCCLFFVSFSSFAGNEKKINTENTSNLNNQKTYKLKIYDEYNLLNKKEITFSDKKSLKKELKTLLAIMIDEGYVTSSISTKDGKITVVPGKIDQVELQDDSTFFPSLKKKIFGLNLENKILNISDINKFVERYNKNTTNKLKVSVINSDKANYSNIIVKNDYKFKISPKIEYQYVHQAKSIYQKEDSNKYTIGTSIEQILGFNDSLNLNALLEKKDKTFLINYNFLLRDTNFNLSYALENKEIDLNFGNTLYDKNRNFNFSLSQEIIKRPDLFTTFYASFNKEKEQEKFRQTLIYKRNHLTLDTGLSIKKYIVHNQDIYTLFFMPNISYKLTQPKEPKNLKNSLCFMTSPQLSLNTPYYNMSSFLGYSKLVSGDFLYDKCLFDNNISDFDNVPLKYKSSFVSYIDNTFKYPISLNKFFIYPFLEIAFGRDFKTDENLSGLGAGVIFSINNFEFGTKYSGTKHEQAFTMKLSVKF